MAQVFYIMTFRRTGRNHDALQRNIFHGFGKDMTISYKRKSYKKARWRRAEQRVRHEWGI